MLLPKSLFSNNITDKKPDITYKWGQVMSPFFLATTTFSLLLVKKKVVAIFERITNFCNQFFWLQKNELMKLLKTIHISLRKHRMIIRSNDDITDISMITLGVHFFQNETFKGTLGNGIPKNFKKVLC